MVQLHGFSTLLRKLMELSPTWGLPILLAKCTLFWSWPRPTLQSILRLEICGALILSRILKRLNDTLQIFISEFYAWTDSTIMLDWLHGNSRRFKVFVGDWVSETVDNLSPSHWRHVPTDSYLADCASRGCLPLNLKDMRCAGKDRNDIWLNHHTGLPKTSLEWKDLAKS